MVGLAGALSAIVPVAAIADRVEVSRELSDLAAIHGFEIAGLSETRGAWVRAEGDTLYQRLRALLVDYDHIILADPDGAVQRIIVVGEKSEWTPSSAVSADADGGGAEEVVLETMRRGAQRAVAVSLEAAHGQRIDQAMLIDTGADFVVLPQSFVGRLGIDPRNLRQQQVQTANGKVGAQLGVLPGVWLNDRRVAEVEVAFIEDEMLGGNALFGMSVLGRFRMTIDDERNELRLVGPSGR
jgi:clan AA aspartic protease (TIGR02281 family)